MIHARTRFPCLSLSCDILLQWGKEMEICLYSMVTVENAQLWVNFLLGLVIFVTTGKC